MAIFITMALPPPPPQQPSSSSSSIVIEISVVSMEGLNNYTSFFNPTVRPFITITNLPPPTHLEYLVMDSWDNNKFRVAVDPTFFSDRYSCLCLQLFTKRRLLGPAQLGWCLIPASDIGIIPPGSIRHLSYRLRARDGSRGHAIINISIQLEAHANVWGAPTLDTCHTVIGIPVTAVRTSGNREYSESNTISNTEIMR